MNAVKILTILILCSLAVPIHLVRADDEPVEKKESSWSKDAWDNFKSPVTTDAKYPLIIGAGVTVGLILLEDLLIDPAQDLVVKHKPLGRFSVIGDVAGTGIPNALYAVGMLGYGLLGSDSEAKRNANGMFQASVYSSLITLGLKVSVREPRPDGSNRESFPSGHTNAAFSFAAYVGCRHGLGWGVAAYTLAAYVGFSRMNDNKHYLHDVTAGAAIGTAYGLGVCFAENERSEAQAAKQSMKWFAAPTDGGAMAGFTIRY